MKKKKKNCIGYNGQKSKNRDFRRFRKIFDIGVFYMSSISAMGPHFFHWKNKLWVWGGRSRLALSENIKNYFWGAVYDRFMPSKPPNLRDPYKIRFSIFFEKTKNVVNPMVWRCREFFFSKIFGFLNLFRPDFFRILIFVVIFLF